MAMDKKDKMKRHTTRAHDGAHAKLERAKQATRLSDAHETFDEKSSSVQKQYPPKVGYHGTDQETSLNPEE